MAQHQAAQATDWGAATAHGFSGVNAEERAALLHISDTICPPAKFLPRDGYHLGDRVERADAAFEERQAEARQTTLDCLRAGLAQMPVGVRGAVPAPDAEILAAFDDRIDANHYPLAQILCALRGDMTGLWKWAEEAFSQAAEAAADGVRYVR